MTLNVSVVLYNHSWEQISSIILECAHCKLIRNIYLIDNSPQPLRLPNSLPSAIVYIFAGSNLGYGSGHNIAIRKSIESNFEYHLVLNPDILFRQGTLEKIIEFMNGQPQIGNLMPMVCYPDGSIQYLCKLLPTPYDWIGRRFNPLRNFVEGRNQLFELQFTGYNKIMEVPYLSGCFMFLRVDALRMTGLFDEKIFMYGEETDLCRRLIAGGYKTVFYPEASIIHEFQKGSHKSWRLTWIGIKSAIYYFNKWGWFFDKERKRINKETLRKLGYKK